MSENEHSTEVPPTAVVKSPVRQAGSRAGYVSFCVLGLLIVHALLLAWGGYRHSPTIDEVRWLPAGVAHWATGRFDVARVNPPFVRMVAAVPVLLAEPRTERTDGTTANVYRDFIELNGVRSAWLFTLGRWACIPFSLIGGYCCYCWARELYGTTCGLVALTLWCFSPNVLAHAQIVANDAPGAALAVAAGYLFWRWLKKPTWERAFIAGLTLGVAELAKTTLILFLGLWPLLWLVWSWSMPREPHRPRWQLQVAQLLVLLAIGLNVLNLGYGYEGSFRRLGDYAFGSQTLRGLEPGQRNRFTGTWLGELPLPLPAQYVLGLDEQKRHFEGSQIILQTYVRGRWTTHGVWYFYLYALAIKVPIGTWCLLLLSAVLRAFRLDRLKRGRDEMLLIVPALTVLLLASSQPGFTDHLRYILPAFPFVFVWISRVGWALTQRPRPVFLATAFGLAWSVGSSLWIYPHSLSYFNEFVGGPKNGHYHLVSSNIDYGQDLLYLKEWLDEHPQARPFHLAYWNLDSIDPAVLGVDFPRPPSGPAPRQPIPYSEPEKLGPQPGWHAANVNVLQGDDWPGRSEFPQFGYYGYLLNFEPVAMAGYSIYIYHISLDEANRVRRQMNLPPIAQEQ